MAASDCILRRTLRLSRTAPNQRSQVVCRETLYVLDVLRYTRDLGSSVYFPHTIFSNDNLYDVTLSDRDCRLRVTLDPGLNELVERNVLRSGAVLRTATLAPAMTGLADRTEDQSFILVTVEMSAAEGGNVSLDSDSDRDWDSLPWSGSSDVSGPLLANRGLFLPLWNNVDFHGDAWKQSPPLLSGTTGRGGAAAVSRPSVTIKSLREGFLGRKVWARGNILRRLIVRITAKSQLIYFGKADRNSKYPYQLEACDRTESVLVVLWNNLCVDWFCVLQPGDIISLSHFRVKHRYRSDNREIEISANSQNLTARLALLPEAALAPANLPPPGHAFSFCSSEELPARPHDAVCDVIGCLTFAGRSERLKKGSQLSEYRWLRLEDGRSARPIWIQLFSTSQPETHRKLHPLMVVVCSRLKVVQTSASFLYLTNTPHTIVQLSGGRRNCVQLPAVQEFFTWLQQQDQKRLLRSALVGGYFVYPPAAVSLATYMRDRAGEPGFLQGPELLQEMKKLCYRERRTFCIQATVTMVTYCRRGEEERCMFWQNPSFPVPSLPSSPAEGPWVTPPQASSSSQRPSKRKLPRHSDTPPKGRPQATVQPQGSNQTALLFEASMEFLESTDAEEEDQDDASRVTCPAPPSFPHIAVETLAVRYSPARKQQQAVAVTMGGSLTSAAVFACDDYYTLRLKVLSDDTCIFATFLPHSPLLPRSGSHGNTWASILSHGGFSSGGPPPTPGDLIGTAKQLANQRLACCLDVCHLGGDSSEVVLSRAFPLI
ncbi:RPA-related protein RADX isoform X2 [Syngnathoides biaculeatus]|uniref:RPA-related protein RADX isoform X2 n=1 Tax=Syngnathoides biaculeatus TaxID=300417 RepID=UPI002ADDA9A5|nr:RPA-related protein RADX isoform X2 [Syngnathoides biaculeatus]